MLSIEEIRKSKMHDAATEYSQKSIAEKLGMSVPKYRACSERPELFSIKDLKILKSIFGSDVQKILDIKVN